MEENRLKLSKYSSQIPKEIKELFDEINSEKSYAIIGCLLNEGKQTHAQLKDKLGLDNRTLIESLNKMTVLVDQKEKFYFLEESEEIKGIMLGPLEETTYSLSETGKDFMKNVYATFEVEVPKKKGKD